MKFNSLKERSKNCLKHKDLRTDLKNKNYLCMYAIIYFMETKVSFNLREPNVDKPTNINLICRINGKPIKINIGCEYNILPKHWDKKSKTALINNSIEKIYIEHNTEINKRIAECRTLFNEWKNYIAENTNLIYDSETLLRNYINGKANSLESSPIDWFYNYIETICTAKNTSKTQYKRHLKVFEAFLKEKGVKLNSFSQFTYEIIKKFELYLIDKNEMVRTINDKMTVLILLLNAAENYSLIDLNKNRINKYKKIENKLKSEAKVYLTEDEIDKIYQLKLTGRKKVVRDIFIVQCYLGQRISDMSLKTAIIKEEEIELIQKKTSQSVTIPLITPIVKEILSEYNYSFPLNIVTDRVNMNGTIKEIVKEAGINEICNKKEQFGTEIKVIQKEKWELVTTHTARHSFITNLLIKGHSREQIKKITGHLTDSAFDIYNNMTSSNASKAILEKENKLKEEKKKEKENIEQKININESFEWDSEERIKEYLITKLKDAGIFNTNRDTRIFIDTIVYVFFHSKDKYNSSTDLYSDIDSVVCRTLEFENKFSEDTLKQITYEIRKHYQDEFINGLINDSFLL